MLSIYKSSAGSGKTYTLVREFLRIALKSPDKFKHVLAITFTNKAANEMKERVISALTQIGSNHPNAAGLISELAKQSQLDEAVVIDKADKMLRSLLHNYSDFSVSTIDSFIHRVIRAFTYDLHLPMSFEIEMDRDLLLTETIEILMDRLSDQDDTLTGAIVEFAESNIEEGKSWNLEHSLIRLAQELFNEDAYPYLDRLAGFDLAQSRKARESLYKFVNGFEQKLFNEGKQAIDIILNSGLTAQSFYQTTKGIFGFFFKYSNGEFPADECGNSFVRKAVEEGSWHGSKASNEEKAAIQDIKQVLTQHYNNIVALYNKEGKDYALAKLLISNFYSFILLADIQKLMDEYKKQENILHVSEFQRKVHAIVKEQDAPVIYERIGEWYDSILIDEHQDTSVLQWQNLLPLIENSQLKGQDSLVVGDGKQAIYRFRNGKVEQFAALPNIYGAKHDLRLLEREVVIHNHKTETKQLEKNFRSRDVVIDFNNDLYNALSALPDLQQKEIYHLQAQQKGKGINGGYVSIDFLEDDDEQDRDELCLKKVDEIIAETTAKGYELKDVAVLTRSNKNAAMLASHLIERGIPVVSSESLLINNSPRVKLLLSVLYYFEQKKNTISRAEMLFYIHLLLLKKEFRFEQFGFNDEDDVFEQNVSAVLGKEFRSYNFINYGLVELLHQLILFFGMDDNDPFLQFFMDEALAFAQRNRANVREFLDWWNEVKYSKCIIYPETLNAVKIMTIHKSKGLEFPVVILADADWPQKLSKKNFWVELNKPWLPEFDLGILPAVKDVLKTEFAALYEEEEAASFLDMLNLLYVATTRAEERLYILSTKLAKEPLRNSSITALLITFLKQQELWQGFEHYQFGEEGTTKIEGSNRRNNKGAFVREKIAIKPERSKDVVIRRTSELVWDDEARAKVEHGKYLHTIMQRIKHATDAPSVLMRLVSEGMIKAEQLETLSSDIADLLANNDIKAYFEKDYKVINERPLLTKEKQRIPDRVVVKGDEAVVIDYKTGVKDDGHVRQVKGYMNSLAEIGFKKVKGFLVYVEAKEIVAV